MNGDWGTPTARTIEWYDPKITATAASHMSGLEFLRAIADGKLPPAPIGRAAPALPAFPGPDYGICLLCAMSAARRRPHRVR